MSASRFNAECRAGIVARVELGAPFTDAAARAGVRPETARSWLTRGRREAEGEYSVFAADVERARVFAAARRGPLSERELRVLVSGQVRAGSVRAMKLYWEMLKADKAGERRGHSLGDPLAEFDELADRRVAHARAGRRGA